MSAGPIVAAVFRICGVGAVADGRRRAARVPGLVSEGRSRMRTYDVTGGGGLRLYVEETGNPRGPSVLFIHGLSQRRLAWNKPLHSDLAPEFRLVAMDLRGHGGPDKPP